MQNIVVIFLSLIAGFLLKKSARFPVHTAQALNSFVISISLPALILLRVPRIFDGSDPVHQGWVPVLFMWIMFFLAWGIIIPISKKLNWSPQKTGAMILTTGLANTSFVGLPLLKATVGDGAIPFGILADQPGEFLIVSTLGILVAAFYSGKEVSAAAIAKRILYFPPFIALIASFIWTFFGFQKIELLNQTLEILSNTLVPLALFAVGFQAKFNLATLQRRFKPLSIGLTIRLFLIPFIFFLIFNFFKGDSETYPTAWLVTILESAMATQITSAVVANEFHLDGEMANLMVTFSVPLSLLTIPLWHYFLS